MVQSDAPHDTPRPEDMLLDPIRQAIRSFVSSVEASSKQMTVAAERFALDSAQLIRTASAARRHTRRAAHQESDAANLRRSTSAVTEAASQAAASARVAAGAVNLPPGEHLMSEAETIAATARRLQRLEEDISILTGLLREVYDRVGANPPGASRTSAAPTAKTGPRRFRMRTSGRLARPQAPRPPEQRLYGNG